VVILFVSAVADGSADFDVAAADRTAVVAAIVGLMRGRFRVVSQKGAR